MILILKMKQQDLKLSLKIRSQNLSQKKIRGLVGFLTRVWALNST